MSEDIPDYIKPTTNQTLGRERVGVDFNPSQNPEIDKAKSLAAALIDQMDYIASEYKVQCQPGQVPVGEVLRLTAIAMTHFEEGAMVAVKAIVRANQKQR